EPGVLAYSWVLAMLSSLAFGALPAMAATAPWRRGGARPDLTALQRSSGARLRSALMVGQLAASVVLLVLAGLIASNAREVARTEFGFDPARTIAVHAWPPTTQLVRALEALPQVHRVAAVSAVPLTGGAQRVHARIGARSEPLHVRAANAEFFDVFGIQSVHGRALHRADEGGAMVAVVSRRTAELLWPGQDPLGRTLELPPDDPPGSMPSGTFEVVGVVEDVVSNSFVQGIDPTAVYVPAKVPHAALGSLVVHSVDSAPATQQAIMEACVRAAAERNCELMPLLLAIKFQRLPFLAASVAAASLGWIALAISCIGLHGLVSYVVVQTR